MDQPHLKITSSASITVLLLKLDLGHVSLPSHGHPSSGSAVHRFHPLTGDVTW